jgi:hippurate hydrolase
VLAAINRVVKAEAEAAGAERMPLVEHYEGTSALYNDPKLTQHLSGTLAAALGKDNVTENPPGTASEDYSYYIDAGVPSFFFSLGASDPQKIAESKASGKPLPGPHSPLFAPVAEPALRTGITAEVAVLRELLKGTSADARNLVGPQPIISLAK